MPNYDDPRQFWRFISATYIMWHNIRRSDRRQGFEPSGIAADHTMALEHMEMTWRARPHD